MANFPNNPTPGQEYTTGGVTYSWDGFAWVITSVAQTAATPAFYPDVDFPSNPVIDQEFTFNGTTWVWDGSAWVLKFDSAFLPVSGGTLTGKLVKDVNGFLVEENYGRVSDGLIWERYHDKTGNKPFIDWRYSFTIDRLDIFAGGADWLYSFDMIDRLDAPTTRTVINRRRGDARYALLNTTMLWKGEWVENSSYLANDVVRDGPWTMVANKATTDRPAPQPLGVPSYLYDGASPESTENVSLIVSGQEYLNSNNAFFIDGYRLYTVAGHRYQVLLVTAPDTIEENTEFLGTFTATQTGWQEFSTSTRLIPSNIKFRLLTIARKPDPSPVVTLINYNYVTPPGNIAPPAAGQARHNGRSVEYISFHKTDNDGTDRGAYLIGLSPGDTITPGLADPPIIWTVQSVVDQGTYVDVYVSPAVQENATGVSAFDFSVSVAQPVTFVRDTNYWLANQPNAGVVKGLYVADGSYKDVAVNDNAYGVDLLVQAADISDDWDIITVTNIDIAPSRTPPVVATFHDPTQLGSWQLVNNKLECWGITNVSGTGVPVTFPKTFARRPSITLTPAVDANTDRSCVVSNGSPTGFNAKMFQQTGVGAGGEAYWYAVGEWDGIS